MPRMSKIRRWEIFTDYFNTNFVLSGDRTKDKQRLSIRYTRLLTDSKTEENPVKRKALLEVAGIIKSMMED